MGFEFRNVGVDKDALIAAREVGMEIFYDSSGITAMATQATDVGGGDDSSPEEGDNLRIDIGGNCNFDQQDPNPHHKLPINAAVPVNIIVMVHKPHEVVTFGLPIYTFCGAIVPTDVAREAVAKQCAKPGHEGWGIPLDPHACTNCERCRSGVRIPAGNLTCHPAETCIIQGMKQYPVISPPGFLGWSLEGFLSRAQI